MSIIHIVTFKLQILLQILGEPVMFSLYLGAGV